MSSRNDRSAAAAVATAAAIAAIAATAAVTLLVPLPAFAGLAAASPADDEPAVLERQDRTAGTPAGTYQLRCWQQGRLVFEENGVRISADDGHYATRLRGTDRQGDPIIVADTRNATCLIRPERPDSPRPR